MTVGTTTHSVGNPQVPIAAAYQAGFLPYLIRNEMERAWYSCDCKFRHEKNGFLISEQDFASRKSFQVYERWFVELEAQLQVLLREFPDVAKHVGCIPALVAARKYLRQHWIHRDTQRERQSRYLDEDACDGSSRFYLEFYPEPVPNVEVFQHSPWHKFSVETLDKLAENFRPMPAAFFRLGQHLGRVLFPPAAIERALGGTQRWNWITESDAPQTAKHLLAAAALCPFSGWWPNDKWNWGEMIKSLEAPKPIVDSFRDMDRVRLILRQSMERCDVKTEPYLRRYHQNRFGLCFEEEGQGKAYTVNISRQGDRRTLGPCELTGKTAELAVLLIKATGYCPTTDLIRAVGTTGKSSMSQLKREAQQKCFDHLGIVIETKRESGYRLVEQETAASHGRK